MSMTHESSTSKFRRQETGHTGAAGNGLKAEEGARYRDFDRMKIF
jgi:hypothetical protein